MSFRKILYDIYVYMYMHTNIFIYIISVMSVTSNIQNIL